MNNDLISRSTLDGMKLFVAPEEKPDKETIGWNRAIDYVIKTAPAADAVPMDFHERCLGLEVRRRFNAEETARRCIENYEPVRHGRWINKMKIYPGMTDYRFDCSECEHIFWHGGVETFKYCPWCGARMDGDEHA